VIGPVRRVLKPARFGSVSIDLALPLRTITDSLQWR
jgi:hypothetical protein